MSSSSGAPLVGVKGADFSRTLAGAHCSTILSDLGAEMIMIDSPRRVPGGVAKGGLPATIFDGVDVRYNYETRGKKSLSLDVNSPKGREVFLDLVKKLDIVIDNWRPGTNEKLGLDYERLKKINPRIIRCSITGYGSTGPYRDRGSWDMVAAAHAGLLSLCGEPGRPPVGLGPPIVDTVTGIWAAQGVISALYQRERTNSGQKVEVSLFEVVLSLLVHIPTAYLLSGRVPGPPGAARPTISLAGVFKTRDGYIVTGVVGDRMFLPLCRALGHEEWANDPRFVSEAQRVQNKGALWALVQEVLVTKTSDEWIEALLKERVPAAPVNTIDKVVADPQVQHLNMLVTITGVEGKAIKIMRNPVNFSSYQPVYGPAPGIGEHTQEVLSQFLGYSEDKIEELRQQGVI